MGILLSGTYSEGGLHSSLELHSVVTMNLFHIIPLRFIVCGSGGEPMTHVPPRAVCITESSESFAITGLYDESITFVIINAAVSSLNA